VRSSAHFVNLLKDSAQHRKMPPTHGTLIPFPAIFITADSGTPSKLSLQPELEDACDFLHGRTWEFSSSVAESVRSCSCRTGSQSMTAGCGGKAKPIKTIMIYEVKIRLIGSYSDSSMFCPCVKFMSNQHP